MTDRTDSLLSRQTDPPMMALLRAMSVCHARAQRLDAPAHRRLRRRRRRRRGRRLHRRVGHRRHRARRALGRGQRARARHLVTPGSSAGPPPSRRCSTSTCSALPWNAVAAGRPGHRAEVSRLDRAFRGTNATSATTTRCRRCPRPTTCSPASTRASAGAPGCAAATRTRCSPRWRPGRRSASSSA